MVYTLEDEKQELPIILRSARSNKRLVVGKVSCGSHAENVRSVTLGTSTLAATTEDLRTFAKAILAEFPEETPHDRFNRLKVGTQITFNDGEKAIKISQTHVFNFDQNRSQGYLRGASTGGSWDFTITPGQ